MRLTITATRPWLQREFQSWEINIIREQRKITILLYERKPKYNRMRIYYPIII